jgi:tetratricopeptide (TPR) repeat protein
MAVRAAEPPPTESGALDEVRRSYHAAVAAESGPDRERFTGALKAFIASVESHLPDLTPSASEVAPMLDEASMAFYRASMPELARRSVDLGLQLAPGAASLLHHKALILLAQNQDLPEVLSLLDRAIEGNPYDKGIWATRGDALKLLDRPTDAADAYLRAQQLDAVSMQYVDKALKLVPDNPRALQMKIDLARARGGDAIALEACDELLKGAPDDLELYLARAELLVSLGRVDEAREPLARVRSAKPHDPRAALLELRLLYQAGKNDEAQPVAKAIIDEPTPEPAALEEVARTSDPILPEIALAARSRLQQVDPRNLQNLLDLRALAVRLERADVGLAACRAVLELQPQNLEAMRGIAELEIALDEPGKAIDAYRELLEVHPHAVADLRKALELARQASDQIAIREFAQAILAQEPNDLGAQVEVARHLVADGDQQGAVMAYDQLLTAHPGQLEYLLEKKEIVAKSGDPTQLTPVLDELFRLDPTRTDIAVERGNLYLGFAYEEAEGSVERDRAARTALVAYERASTDPDAANSALLGIARASRLVDDRERALKAYRDFLARPGNVERNDIRKEYGHALREAGRFSEAIETYTRAISGGLEDPDLFWGAVEVLAQLNQEVRALQLLELLLQRDPNNPMFLRKKGQLLLASGRRAEALRVLQNAVAGAHADPQAHFEVAEALRSQGAYADAITYYRHGLEIDPANRHGRLALAETLLLAGQYPEVLVIIDPLLKEDPNDLAAWKARADAWRALGRPSEVAYSLRAMLLLEPENPSGLLEMYRLHQESGETREAYDTLGRLLQTDAAEAHDASLHLERGDLAAALGLADEANMAYQRAAEIDPVYRVEIALRRARLRLTAGRPDLALEMLDEGLKAVPANTPPGVAALLLRAEILAALERPAEARTVYEEVLKREPKSPVALAGVARSLLDEGQHGPAAEFLRNAIPQGPPQETLYLLLAEAESGLGHLDNARDALVKGTETIPKSVALWVRLGELGIARQAWADAANAFAHALALSPSSVEVLLRAGFVAERLEHPNEALAFYERATEADPANKQAWTSRGLAQLATGRPADAQGSFDRALALDSDFGPAKDGKKLALQRTRDADIQRFGREALLLEARLHRTVAKNDLFVTLHVPYEFLEPVLTAIGRTPKIDLDRLSPTDVRDLENSSYHLITSALERRIPGLERRGLSLADVAVLAPPTYSLDQIEKLFGYLRAVLEADLRPENLRLTPDVEELARKALLLPPEQRTLFQLVRNLRVGVYKARLIKIVEQAGSAVHAPLPNLDLGAYSPEFRPSEEAEAEAPAEPAEYLAPETTGPVASATAAPTGSTDWSAPPAVMSAPVVVSAHTEASPGTPRCIGCGGISSVLHSCGAPLCQHCIGQFPNCPKCGQPVTTETTRAISGVVIQPVTPRHSRTASAIGGIKSVFQRSKPPPTRSHPVAAPETPPKPSHPTKTGHPTAHPAAEPPRSSGAPATPSKKSHPTATPATQTGAPTGDDAGIPEPPPPPPPRRREKTDDEPRL